MSNRQNPPIEERGFPLSLLDGTVDERFRYFKEYMVEHHWLTETQNRLEEAIISAEKGTLIFLYGPTRVGKSTLRKAVMEKLTRRLLPDLKNNPGMIPVAWTPALPPDPNTKIFSWRDYYKEALIALEEPMIGKKTSIQNILKLVDGQLEVNSRIVKGDLRSALSSALKNRKPIAFFIEEGQHIVSCNQPDQRKISMDLVKSLADTSETVHVLIGTYELLEFDLLSDQLNGRRTDIHFPSYKADNEDDRLRFIGVLKAFQRRMPLLIEPDLVSKAEYCYERSLGCVGVLKRWFSKSLLTALNENASTLTQKHLQRHQLKLPQLKTMFGQIVAGENKLRESSSSIVLFRQSLGLHGEEKKKKAKEVLFLKDAGIPKTPRNPHRPGMRKPKRDRVGRSR